MELEKLTKETYKCPKGEELSYHCVIEIESYDRNTGRKLSRPRLQKFGRKAFEQGVYDRLLRQGYKIKVLHNPTEWLKAKNAELEALAEQKAKAQAEAEAKAKAEAEEKAKAEIEAKIEAEVQKRLAAAEKEQLKKEKKTKEEAPAKPEA